ncbi:MAG TPA: glycosyl hydrolase 115 family protein [Bryobacteraceae bacterium]|nr:glycosyl hydrolase 115 family protein [Bryobacteraceae bacterium]
MDTLVRASKLNVESIRGKWETFAITVVKEPLPGVKQALVIAGSDRRATAFGVFELSKEMGVSPWYWWADVVPRHCDTLAIHPGFYKQGPPSVKYRGIFINDEDWGIRPWAGKTFDSKLGDIGPKTYRRVFELLLRLKANLLWPAMHECTQAFNNYPDNKSVADDYAIVMSSSHAEPMLRNNVTEWDSQARGPWDYAHNRESVRNYWDQRAAENGKFENLFEIGMRGIHDSPMPGPSDLASRVNLLEQVFHDQREILSHRVNPDVARVPQIFCAYKEVLQLYQAGLKVPDDAILGWADDNFGYTRQLSTPAQQHRAGGSGMYYHVSYWGAPHDYLWLCTTPPSLIWEEMSKAYDYQTRAAWILNVGDIKPAELDTEFFLSMAWDMSRFAHENQKEFLAAWAAREFSPRYAAGVADILDEYYRLSFARKPEHMGWNSASRPVSRTEFTPVSYGDEAQLRLNKYARLDREAERIYADLPANQKDSFYELVLYPVRAAGLMNQKMLYADRSYLYAAQGRASTNDCARKVRTAFARIELETNTFNQAIAGGKWRYMMSSNPRNLSVFDLPATALVTPVPGIAWGIAVEGHTTAMVDHPARAHGSVAGEIGKWARSGDKEYDLLPPFDAFTRRKHFVDIFKCGTTPFAWTASTSAPWISLSAQSGRVDDDQRIWVDILWAQAPKGTNIPATITFRGPNGDRTVRLEVSNPDPPVQPMPRFVESDGVVSMEAEHFTRQVTRNRVEWRVLPDLGRTGGTVSIFPSTAPSLETPAELPAEAPALEYDFYNWSDTPLKILVTALPTQRIDEGRHLRYAVALDDDAPVPVNLEDGSRWDVNVLRAAVVGSSEHAAIRPGRHTLRLWMMDPGVVLDKIVLNFGGLRPSYLGPPETVNTAR